MKNNSKVLKNIIKQANSISISELENIKIGDANAIVLANEIFSQQSLKHRLGNIKRLLENIFLKKILLEKELTGKRILMLYSGTFFRKDYLELFLKVAKCVNDVDIIKPILTKKRFNNFKIIRRNLSFVKQILTSKCGLTKTYKLVLATEVSKMGNILEQLKDFDFSKYKLVCVFDDSSSAEHILVEKLNFQGISTATLQHGAFGGYKETERNIDELGLEYKCSNSKYFLAWNKDTVMRAEKSGMQEGKCLIAGIPQYIGMTAKTIVPDNKQCFGVVLNGPMFENHNIALVRIANEISEKLRINYILRYHPHYIGTEYEKYTNEFYSGISSKSETIRMFGEKIDFTVLTCSSVFNEMIFMGVPVFRYEFDPQDKFGDVKECSFSTMQDFILLKESNLSETLFDRFCTIENIDIQYRKVFGEITDVY